MSENKLVIKKRKGEDGYKTFSIRIKQELVFEIDEIVKKTGRSRNELIQVFLEYALRNSEIEK